nr:MAG TPA: hypothetical protein [Caudoviricetes sp.]
MKIIKRQTFDRSVSLFVWLLILNCKKLRKCVDFQHSVAYNKNASSNACAMTKNFMFLVLPQRGKPLP